jgi:hypothetical protein
MRKHRLFLAAAVAMGVLAPAAAAEAAETVYGVTASNQLVSFSSDSPGNVSAGRAIAGLQAGESILGIDVRPATGDLTALGSTGRLYIVDPGTAQATQIEGTAPLSLQGSRFGVDFNPLADALRVVSDSGQNLRVTAGGTGTVNTDGALNPGTPSVTAAAYANNFHGTTATTLFDLDTGSDRLVRQNPPNNGTLEDVGPLGVDLSPDAAFDIAPSDGTAYAAGRIAGEQTDKLFTVNLGTGAATPVGPIGGARLSAIAIARQAPSLYALVGGSTLVTTRSVAPFDKTTPLDPKRSVAITGLQGGEQLVGVDVRPATGELLGVGTSGRVYVIDPRTGRAVSRTGTPFTLAGSSFGVDFNPVPDALRIVSDDEQNLRITAGGTGVVNTDGALNPGTPHVVGAAYLNPFAGATATTLYDVDAGTNRLVTQNPPNNGTLVDVGPLGITTDSDELGFDIAAQDNAAFLAADADPAPGGASLYRVNLATGAAAPVTRFPSSMRVRGVTTAGAGAVGLTATQYAAKEGSDVQIGVMRTGGAGTVTVNYAVDGISAGALTFEPGETFKTISVPNPDDTQAGPGKTVNVTLSRAAGGYRLGTTAATLTIADDDKPASTDQGSSPTPTPDTSRPVALLVARDVGLRTLRRRGVSARFACNEACNVSARLTLGGRLVGRGSARLAGPGVKTLRVKLSSRGKRIVGRGKTRRLRLSATFRDAAGNAASVRDTFRATR